MKKSCFAAALCGPLLWGCAYVPPLEQAAGYYEPHILISEIVDRVKCELSDAFDDKLEDPRFAWAQGWTAKVDLTLQINDQAGVSPTASYTQFQKNAFNYAAGSTSLTTTSIAAVEQFFTLSAGAGYNESAQRAETVSFTVSLKELREWRNRTFKHIVREDGPDAAARFCFSNKPELRGNLGLQEWVNSALYPVETGQLQSGIHPSNPPIDGLLHSLQFIVLYNASVTPNWSLLVWKGPGLTLPGASLSGTKTDVLNIALGSPQEQSRLIQNVTVSNTTTH